eukprot:scaffold1163_cov362-Prasinococcus_capsulatus_cf.AAC.3
MELNTAQRLQAAYPQTFIFGPPSRKSVKGKGEMLCCVLHDIRMDPQASCMQGLRATKFRAL